VEKKIDELKTDKPKKGGGAKVTCLGRERNGVAPYILFPGLIWGYFPQRKNREEGYPKRGGDPNYLNSGTGKKN